MGFLFPRDLRGLHVPVVPRLFCNQRVHPLVHFTFSLEFVSRPGLPVARTPLAPSLRFLPPSRHQLEESTHRELPSSHVPFRSQCSSHSQRFAPLLALRTYFTPQPRPRFAFQGFSPPPSQQGSSPCRALMTLAKFIYCKVALTAPTSSARSTRLCS